MGFLGIGSNTPSFQNATATNIAVDPETVAKQNALVAALQGVASGTGPSAVTEMLKNNSTQNAAAQQAAAAGARGVNPALAMRNAAEATVQANQGSAQAAAAGRAQEAIGAMGAEGQQLATIQGQNLEAQRSNQQAGLGAAAINAQQATAIGQNQSGLLGGALGGIGAAIGLAKGGVVPMAEGGDVGSADLLVTKYLKGTDGSGADALKKGASTFTSSATKSMMAPAKGPSPITMPTMGSQFSTPGPTLGVKPAANPTMAPSLGVNTALPGAQPANIFGVSTSNMTMAKGGKVPALVSPGERYLPPSEVKAVKEGKKNPMAAGERIPGKPKVNKDSYANDTVHKVLKSGGIVLPLHITQAPDAPKRAAEFVAAITAHKRHS